MSFADDETVVPFDDEAEAARAPKRSGGIDLSKFVPDADETGDAAVPEDDPEAGGEDVSGDVSDDMSEDVSDEELEKVRPVLTDEPEEESEAESDADDGEDEESGPARRKRKADAPVDIHLRAAVEAVIFAAEEPVTPALVAKATGAKPGVVKKAILEIQERLDSTGSGLLLQELGGGFTFTTHAEHAPAIRALRKTSSGRKLSAAAIDTLAIVAYKQPVQRQEIEDVRGVASCGPMLRQLMQLDLVKIVGRAEVLGKPLLYGTTKRFLDMFGLAAIKDLPKVSELEPR